MQEEEKKNTSVGAPGDEKKADTKASAPSMEGSDAWKSGLDQPLKIIGINEEGTSFALFEENLEAIFKEVEKINADKCIILSVVGAFRTGKSFLLDFFLRYLTYSSKQDAGEVDEKYEPVKGDEGIDLPRWMTEGGGSKLLEGQNSPGFLWRAGKERTTTGIWMYGRPFKRTLPKTGESVAVVLMDTQGIFDHKTSRELMIAIFGLSTLISSYQVYNLTKQIQENNLETLHYFTEFSRVALKEFQKGQIRQGKVPFKEGKPPAPFQTLEFLIRDWQNFSDIDNVQTCLEEMPEVLSHALEDNFHDSGTREEIKAGFDTLNCFLLPHPGTKLTRTTYDGDLTVIEAPFIHLLDHYVNRVFTENLVCKRINGKVISVKNLVRYIKAYAELYKSGKLPTPISHIEANARVNNFNARDDALSLYTAMMDNATKGDNFLAPDELVEAHETAVIKTFKMFDNDANFGSDEHIDSIRSELIAKIDKVFLDYQKQNKAKLQNGLGQYIIPLIAAATAWVLDRLTDYTCDAWSASCRSFSSLAALLYYIVALVVGVKFYQIYMESGAAVTGITAMALAQATMERAQTLHVELLGQGTGEEAREDDEKSAESNDGNDENDTGASKKPVLKRVTTAEIAGKRSGVRQRKKRTEMQ